MTFFNVTFDTPGGIQQYQRSLESVLREMAHDCVTLTIQECILRLRTAGSKKEIKDWTILIHEPNHAESLIQAGVRLPRIYFFLHGDYDFYINAAIRHHLWVDQVICVNENTKNILSDFWGLKNVSLLPPIITGQGLSTVPQKDNKPHFVFIGRLEKDKGAHLLSACSRRLNEQNIDHKLTVIYSSHALDALIFEDLTHCEKTNEHIKLHEDLPHQQVMDFLSNAHALLLPSLKEGYPLSVAEAMSVGTIPIVAEYSPDVWAQLPPQLHPFVIDFRNTSEFNKATMSALNISSDLRNYAMAFTEEKNGEKSISKRINRILGLPTISNTQKALFPIFRARIKFNFRKIIHSIGSHGPA
jgi:glycosyltransferase involved in cell wall biosynthesis